MHTAIIIENLGNKNYKVVDSNYVKKLTVGVHKFNPWKDLAGDKLHVHFYRLGDVSSPSPQPEPADDRITFFGVGDIKIGDSREKVEKVYGEAQTGYDYDAWEHGIYGGGRPANPEWHVRVDKYDGIEFHYRQDVLALIKIDSSKYQTDKGIKVGDSLEALTKAHSSVQNDEDAGVYNFIDGDKEIDFNHKDGKIVNIRIGLRDFLPL